MDTYFSTTSATTIPEGVTPTATGYSDVTLTATSADELLLRASAPVFGAADKGKIVWCQNELRTIQLVQNAYEILISTAFSTAPSATAFRLITPQQTRVWAACSADSKMCTPDGNDSMFFKDHPVSLTANVVLLTPGGGATIAGTFSFD